ncbi:TPA: hypothetical protein UM365_000190 [Stenotrophomonas maltophilia]|jgi:hypothetical protein|uniref:Uncharacterized protein n=2 Tax=Stenotrophomonas maltophilia TaxID=40324 RepID=A0A2J0T0Y2_STEMA|nr:MULTISPECIES: hypothetical protein [Stenotrophomonas]SSM87251.1 Uncharacterised protein [Acinetobacter baumannii]KYK42051.1 hypothetical protein AYX08_15390 [Stenotrophomonas maltophilia]MBA0313184.1 hypothetical protein [Stenotrophomonas maltophilia]MBH1498353.1 hypothetical protein [Stenotrophomonas maltophilia]MBH1534526.1 hypothetical protein [Stenotrophomonas maltophilia]
MELWRTSELQALRQMEGRDAMTVADALGRSPRAVQDMARCQGMPVPRQRHARYWPATTKRRARQLRASGNTVNQISAALGVPFGTVRRWVYEGAAA